MTETEKLIQTTLNLAVEGIGLNDMALANMAPILARLLKKAITQRDATISAIPLFIAAGSFPSDIKAKAISDADFELDALLKAEL